jgi:hypothetical protein
VMVLRGVDFANRSIINSVSVDVGSIMYCAQG